MREIKFRAWKNQAERMYDVTNMMWKDDWIGVNSTDSIGINYVDNHLPNDYELMQYTGLKDKNEVEIYEGDVCLYDGLPGAKKGLPIVWHRGGFFLQGRLVTDTEPLTQVSSHRSMEVIGNIWENPELLK